YGRQNWFEWSAAEHRAVREQVGMFDLSSFGKYLVQGPDILNNFGDPRSGGRIHQGMDILATLGQEVYAMKAGTLTIQTFANSGGSSGLSGNLWRLSASDGTGDYYIYAHLSAFAPGLSKGSVVQQGQLLGWVGDTGNAGPGNYHLHFEIHPGGGNAVNPLPLVTVPQGCKVWG
ncbi:MAG TPA: hypothetical protein DCR14_12310, partial [Acidimicrobiaceae bacterium]|nr:hypothetical protein [Acidimicrobiaceae bacterium]